MSPDQATSAPQPKHKLRVPRARRGAFKILVGTRKGAFVIEADKTRKEFELALEPWHLGWTCFHVVADPRQRKTLLAAANSPSGIPTVLTSINGGRTWSEADEPPRFSEEDPVFRHDDPNQSKFERAVRQVFWLTPGHAYQPGTWFCGTSPQGLFRSDDSGRTWAPVDGLHHHAKFDEWTGPEIDRTPDGAKLHSILIDPRDPDRMFVALSSGGVLETADGGETWAALPPEIAGERSDPHSVVMAQTNPDRLWMQAHGGVFRYDADLARTWERVGARSEDGSYDDAGFPIAVHPADPDVAWTIPMDSSGTWTRMANGGKPRLRRTTDGGASWVDQMRGLPKESAWWTVKRQALCVDGFDPPGLYFGTTSGEVWGSTNEGKRWSLLARGLPHIYSVEIA